MASFDTNSFDSLSFDQQSFDFEENPGAIRGVSSGSSSASGILTAVGNQDQPAVGLSTPVRKRRKRVFKKDIYGCVISGFEEVFNRKPTHSVVSEITDQVAKTLESESDDTAAWLEVQSRIMQILVEMEAQEDEEASLFAML